MVTGSHKNAKTLSAKKSQQPEAEPKPYVLKCIQYNGRHGKEKTKPKPGSDFMCACVAPALPPHTT